MKVSMKRSTRQSGFALVLALSLMAFVLMLILSLTTLTTMELRASTVSRDVELARENALLGLQIAVARLQESVGPDQRFTATSAISGATTNANITGVWMEDSANAFTWLVSGNHSNDPLAVTPATLPNPSTDAGGDEVFLVGMGSVLGSSDRIKLEKEPIASDGHYAYWVGDEGVKVSAAINDETDQLTYNNTRPEGTPVNNIPGDGHSWTVDQYRDELRQMTQNFPNFWLPIGLDYEDVVGSQRLS